jgi:hypothetical protein
MVREKTNDLQHVILVFCFFVIFIVQRFERGSTHFIAVPNCFMFYKSSLTLTFLE